MGSYDYQDRAKDHSMLVCDVIEAKAKLSATGIGFSREDIDMYRDALKFALMNCGSDEKKIVRCVNAFARLYALDQTDRLANKFAIPAGANGQIGEVVKPLHEEIAQMLQSLPLLPRQESTVEPDTARPQPDFGAGILPSCLPPALP